MALLKGADKNKLGGCFCLSSKVFTLEGNWMGKIMRCVLCKEDLN